MIEATASDWLVEALHTVFEFGDPAISCKILSSYDRLTSADTKLLLLKSQLAPDSGPYASCHDLKFIR